MSIYIIGDLHGKVQEYYELIKDNEFSSSIQVGDFGVGFGKDDLILHYLDNLNKNELKHFFIRGNHDNPDICNKNSFPCYLGDWGYLEDQDIFFISGAYSVDGLYRTPGFDWWRNEELGACEWDKIETEYIKRRPKYVVSHDCPHFIYSKIFNYISSPSITTYNLGKLFDKHQPKKWIYGHHHIDITENYDGCEFICLNELSYYKLDVSPIIFTRHDIGLTK